MVESPTNTAVSLECEELLHFFIIWENRHLPWVSINENIFTILLPWTFCHELQFAESSPVNASLGAIPSLKNAHTNIWQNTFGNGKNVFVCLFVFNVSFDVCSYICPSGPYIKGEMRDQIRWQIAMYFKISEFFCTHLFRSGNARPSNLNPKLLST